MPQTIYNTPPFANRTSFSGEVGLELEYDGDNLPRNPSTGSKSGSHWVAHDDGSLRGAAGGSNRGGIEYVLSEPCSREQVRPLLTSLFDYMEKSQKEFIISNRSSTHVHINISQMRMNEIACYVSLWGIFEEALANWCGEDRAGNLFCLRHKDCSTALDALYLSLINEFNFTHAFNEGMKYMGCNLKAMADYGSLEFRTFAGADDIDRLIMWVNFLLALKDYSKNVLSNPEIIPQTFSEQGPEELLRDICRRGGVEEFAEMVINHPANVNDFRSMCFRGVRNFQKICYCLNWTELLPKFNEEYIPSPFAVKVKKQSPTVSLDAFTTRLREVATRPVRVEG